MGARPLQRVISTRIKLPLGKKILFDTISDQKLTVDYDKDSDEFTINQEIYENKHCQIYDRAQVS